MWHSHDIVALMRSADILTPPIVLDVIQYQFALREERPPSDCTLSPAPCELLGDEVINFRIW